MGFLKKRVQKVEKMIEDLGHGKKRSAIFWRDDPEIPGDKELRFFRENPDFKGEVLILCFGTDNLHSEPDGN